MNVKEELQIGDWVYNTFNRQPEQVVEIRQSQVILAYNDGYGYDEIHPIPLTPEILEKNGFKKIESETTSLAENWSWHEKVTGRVYNRYVGITFYKKPINGVSHLTKIETCSQKGDGVNQIHSCDIDYIHELQHALRLCGITKEIQI